jgi:hypothetical protein
MKLTDGTEVLNVDVKVVHVGRAGSHSEGHMGSSGMTRKLLPNSKNVERLPDITHNTFACRQTSKAFN